MIGLSDCRMSLKASSSEFTKISVVLFNALVLDNIWWNLFRHWEHFLLFLSLLSCPHCPLMAAGWGCSCQQNRPEPARTGPTRVRAAPPSPHRAPAGAWALPPHTKRAGEKEDKGISQFSSDCRGWLWVDFTLSCLSGCCKTCCLY